MRQEAMQYRVQCTKQCKKYCTCMCSMTIVNRCVCVCLWPQKSRLTQKRVNKKQEQRPWIRFVVFWRKKSDFWQLWLIYAIHSFVTKFIMFGKWIEKIRWVLSFILYPSGIVVQPVLWSKNIISNFLWKMVSKIKNMFHLYDEKWWR